MIPRGGRRKGNGINPECAVCGAEDAVATRAAVSKARADLTIKDGREPNSVEVIRRCFVAWRRPGVEDTAAAHVTTHKACAGAVIEEKREP